MNTDQPAGVRRVISDIADLGELQLQLLAVDGQEAARRGVAAAAWLSLAAVLLISTITVFLVSLGWILHETLEWPLGLSLLAVAGLAVLGTGLVLGLAYLSIMRAVGAMSETGAEFAENLRWLKAVLTSPDSPRNTIRGERYPASAYAEAARSGGADPRHPR